MVKFSKQLLYFRITYMGYKETVHVSYTTDAKNATLVQALINTQHGVKQEFNKFNMLGCSLQITSWKGFF